MEEVPITRFRAVAIAAMELVIHVGLMDSVSSQWPLEVQENWEQRCERIVERLHREVEEISQFAEAYDDEDEGE